MFQKLWVLHITTAKTFGPTKVSIDGCEYVDDFKGIIGLILLTFSMKLRSSLKSLGLPLISLSTNRMELQKLNLVPLLLITWTEILMKILSLLCVQR